MAVASAGPYASLHLAPDRGEQEIHDTRRRFLHEHDIYDTSPVKFIRTVSPLKHRALEDQGK